MTRNPTGALAACLPFFLAACTSGGSNPLGGGGGDAGGGGDMTFVPKTGDGGGTGGTSCIPMPYPSGPYGVVVGQVIDNLQLVGQHDTNGDGVVNSLDAIAPICLSDYFQNKQIKVLAVLVAAEWCSPCQQEQPELVQSWNNYKTTNAGVAYLEAIIQDKNGNPADITTVDRWSTKFMIPFDMAADPTVALGPYYNIAAFPMQMVIRTSDMTIQWQNNGYSPGALESAVNAALPAGM
jgi:hypothetical protein